MTSFQMQHLKNITEAEEIPLRYLVHYRGRNRNRVFEAIHKLYIRLADEGKINQKRLAKRLGKNKTQINRWLSEPSNLTLDSISDLLLAMNAEITDFDTILLEERLMEAREAYEIAEIGWQTITAARGVTLSGQITDLGALTVVESEGLVWIEKQKPEGRTPIETFMIPPTKTQAGSH